MRQSVTDFLVIGSGVAGLQAALEASRSGKVLVVTKGPVKESSSGLPKAWRWLTGMGTRKPL
jgi:aspartate oxidase